MLGGGTPGLTFGQIGGLVTFSLLLAAGQVLFKVAALAAPAIAGAGGFLRLATLPSFWGALAFYGSATLLWIYLLQTVPLSRAYPFAAIGFIVVPVAGVLFFGERVSVTYVVGSLLIVAGLLTIARA